MPCLVPSPLPLRQGLPGLLIRGVLLIVAILLSASPALARKKADGGPPSIVQQAMAQEDRKEGLSILESYLSSTSKDPALEPWVLLYAGELQRLSTDPVRARGHWTVMKGKYPGLNLTRGAIVGMALVDGGEHPSGNALATLGLYLDTEGLPPSMEADRLRLLAVAAHGEGAEPARIRELARGAMARAQESKDPAVLARCTHSVGAWVDLEASDKPVTVPTGDELSRAQAALLADDFVLARSIAEAVLATTPEGPRALEARYILKRVEARDPVNVKKIGVLLPLTGVYAPPAARQRLVIEAALSESGGGMVAVFKDTEGKPEKAVQALEELVLQDGVVAVLGPLLKEEAEAVVDVAQALQVPLVAFSQKSGITLDRSYVFRGFITPEQQVKALLDWVHGRMGLSSFAIVAPDNPYGHVAADAFEAEVTARQGKVVSKVFYDPTKGDFRDDARQLANVDAKARAGELARLRSQAKAKGMDASKVVLPPLVDFQGIFIPDGYHRVALVASALAYQEFAIGRFRPRRADVPLAVMGLNGWHDDRICTEGGAYVQDGILVDAFDPDSADPGVSSFMERFRGRLDGAPGVVDAMTWDSARIVALAASSGITDRASMREALVRVVLPDPAAGGGKFGPERELDRTFVVLQVGKTSIGPAVDPATLPPPTDGPVP